MKTVADLPILVVEDHPLQRKVLYDLLHRLGCRAVVGARDGIEAMAVLARQPVDVIFCDINMPHMDGAQFAVAQGALARRTGQTLPILIWLSMQDRDVLHTHVSLAHAAGFPRVHAYAKSLTADDASRLLTHALAVVNGRVRD
jgi:CheY-like chemotaxis protein